MEWSDRDDAWSDDRGDERAYPPAPVPAHERAWRHPSEMGQYANHAWAMAEPPVALGRGLLVATGLVGCVLGVAILWLLVPAGGDAPAADVAGPDRPVAAVTRPTQPSAADRSDDVTTSPTSASTSTFASLAPTTVRPAATVGGGSGSAGTLPGEDPPANTVLVAHDDEAPAVAVLLGDSPFLVTTANAVGDLAELTEMQITFADGDTAIATVVSIGDSIAYLASDDLTSVPVGFAQVGSPAPGDPVYALGDQVVSFAFGDRDALAAAPGDSLTEGTPVVDDRGALIGLCTHGDGGWDVVTMAPPPEPADGPATSTTDASSTSTPATSDATEQPAAYLGVSLGLDDVGHVAVLSVTAGSPADAVGIIAGQRILALDGVPLGSPAELVAAVRAHRPGDSIQLTLSASTAPIATTPRDAYGAVTPSTVPATSTSVASSSATTVAAASTTTTTTAATQVTTTVAAAPSSTATPTVTTYDVATYTVTVVLGERAPTV